MWYYNNVKGIGQVKLRSVSLIVTRVYFLKVGSTPIISIKKTIDKIIIIWYYNNRKRGNQNENVFIRNVNNVFRHYNNNNYCKYLD